MTGEQELITGMARARRGSVPTREPESTSVKTIANPFSEWWRIPTLIDALLNAVNTPHARHAHAPLENGDVAVLGKGPKVQVFS